jgi:hypothetical protein
VVEREERSRNPDALPVKPENMRLFLPSELTVAERAAGCQEDLTEMEARLREAQCNDALVGEMWPKLGLLLPKAVH